MQNETPFSATLQGLKNLILSLKKFHQYPNKSFNFSKLEAQWGITSEDVESLRDLILQFQDLFVNSFAGYQLEKKWMNGKKYLTFWPRNDIFLRSETKEVWMSQEEANDVSDMVIYFQEVKIGKGFDIKIANSHLTKKVVRLYKSHPYFFHSQGNCLLYPSPLAIRLGVELSMFKKTNRALSHLSIDEHEIYIEGGT
ncbi:MAG: hypothetical protein KGD73_05700 [Candidatus Lokiarchaeota archaeon]|nr:hypothetical protein [Candidatus Lokiarchaeota archaeon]